MSRNKAILVESVTQQPPLVTRKPWEVLGICRSAWFKLEGRPMPIALPGFTEQVWRIADLVQWISRLPTDRRPRTRKPPERNKGNPLQANVVSEPTALADQPE